MDKKTIEFISKTYVSGKSPRPILRTVATILLIIYILVLIFEVAMDGLSTGNITKSLIPLLLFIYVMNATKKVDGYKATIAKVDIDSQGIAIIYENIDRDDNLGPRNEKIEIRYDNITKIEYSKELRCLNIQGYPVEKVIYQKQSTSKEYIKDYVKEHKEKRTLLYVDGKEKEEIINTLKIKAGINTAFLN